MRHFLEFFLKSGDH